MCREREEPEEGCTDRQLEQTGQYPLEAASLCSFQPLQLWVHQSKWRGEIPVLWALLAWSIVVKEGMLSSHFPRVICRWYISVCRCRKIPCLEGCCSAIPVFLYFFLPALPLYLRPYGLSMQVLSAAVVSMYCPRNQQIDNKSFCILVCIMS